MEPTQIQTPFGPMAIRTSPGHGSPVVCLHGFTLHGGMFATLASLLPRPVIAPDLPGHGQTAIAPVTLDATLVALAAVLEASPRPAAVVGYSQGGRIALHLAVRRPELVPRLVVVSAGLGLDAAARTRRAVEDEALATALERDGLGSFLDGWLAHPLVGTARHPRALQIADRRIREENTASGLAAALRGLGQGVVGRVEPVQLEVPVLWVAGRDDARYAAMAEDLAAAGIGQALVVPDAGHNVVLDAPEALAAAIAGFAATKRLGG